jgi:hypothetical protein
MMRARLITRVLLLLALASLFATATPGIFEGIVYEANEPKVPNGWILVQGRNGMLRKVEISRARVVYAESVPRKDRVGKPSVALVHGTEIRVTAEPDSAGNWRATNIEILRVTKKREGLTAGGVARPAFHYVAREACSAVAAVEVLTLL